jgi:myosin heavy subunit
VFYHLCAKDGLTADQQKALYLESADKFAYLSGGNTFVVDGISDPKLMKGLIKAMNSLKITGDAQQEVFRIVAAVLQLGNIKFKPVGPTDDVVDVEAACADNVKRAADLFKVEQKALHTRLTSRNITVAKNSTHAPHLLAHMQQLPALQSGVCADGPAVPPSLPDSFSHHKAFVDDRGRAESGRHVQSRVQRPISVVGHSH